MRKNEASYEARGVVSVQRGIRPKKILVAFIVTMMALMVMLNVSVLGSNMTAGNSKSLSSLDASSSDALASGLKALGLATASAKEGDDSDAQKYFDGDDDSFTKRKQADNGFKDTSMDSGDSLATENGDKSTPGNDWATTADQATEVTNGDGSNRSAGSGDDGNKAKDFGDSFSMVIRRLWPGYYISGNLEIAPDKADVWDINSPNYAECTDLDKDHKAVIGIDGGEKKYSGYTVDQPTLQNSNCDIPGLGTEGVQDLLSLFDGHGVSNADRQTAKTPFGLGVATELLPTDDVPVRNSARTYKYSGLELFGYNLHWSEYNGEWDHIKVNTSVRLKSSMTFSQGLKTIGQAIGDGVSAFAGSISSKVGGKFKSGNWFGGVLAAINPMTYIDAVKDGFGTAMYKVIANVMNGFEFTALKNGNWYRPNFAAETQYGVRTLTSVEKNAIIIAKVRKVTESTVKGLSNANDLLNYDEATLRTELSPPPAPTVEECKNCTGENFANGKAQDWNDWKEANKDKLENVGKKQLGLDIDSFDNTAGDARKKYAALLSAWNDAIEGKVVQGRDDKVNSSYNAISDLITDSIKKQISDDIMNRPAQAWLYCTDQSGNPSGTPADEVVQEAVKAGLMSNPGKEAYGPNGDQAWQCDQPERPTIVGGLLGSSRKNVSGKYVDTRRTAYEGINVLDMLIGNKIDGWGQTALTWSQNVTIVMNTIVGWCFQPLLDQLGVKDIIVDWMGKLRDTIYFQLVVIIMAFAGIIIMRKLITGHPIDSFKQLAIIILTFGLGVMLLFSPANMVALVDDVPTALERAAIGTIFTSSSNDVLCSTTGTPKGTVSATKVFNDIFGNDTGFNPDSQVRTLQCRIWETFVVTPWSYGQWGTNINQLWADGYASSQQITSNSGQIDVSDDVAKLVGNAGVQMGGGTTINNWGIYQIYTQTSGTSTTEDNDRPTKTVDKNVYRIVDAQAGPDNGAGRDGEHFAAWAGKTGNKFVVGMGALALSVMGLLAIGGLALKKLEYTLMAVILLLCSPFMLLMGLLPGKNQLRLRQYGFEILGLCIKRVVTVVFMCVTLEIMLEVASGSDADWGATFCGLFAILLMIKMYGGELLAMMTKNIDDRSGEWNKADDAVSNYIQSDPTLLGITDAAKNVMLATAGTAIGSALAGQFHNPNTVGRMQQRMIAAYGKGGSANADMDRENVRYNKTKADILKKYAGKTDAISRQKMRTEMDRNESTHKAYLDNYEKNKRLATTLASARGLSNEYVDKNGVTHPRKVGNALSSIIEGAVAYDNARRTGEINQFKKDTITPAQVASDRLAVLMNRTRAVRIRQGKTSAVMEAYRNSNLNWQRSEMRAQQELMARIQANRAEAPTINAQGAISLTAADSVMNSGRTAMSYGVSKNLGMTDEQLQIMVSNAPNKQQLLADWQVAEQTGDWNQVRADLSESAAMQKGTAAYRQLWQPKLNQLEDAKNEAILKQADKTKDAKKKLDEAEFLHAQAVDMGDDKTIKATAKAVRVAQKTYAKQQRQLDDMKADKHGFTKKLTSQILAANAADAKGLMAIEQKKDEVSAVREKAMEKILGKDYINVKRHEQSADGKREFEDTMRSATLKWQSTLEIADKLEQDGQKGAADAMRASANETLKNTRKGFLRSRQMADEWESSFESQLADLHAAHADGKLSDDKYEQKVAELFSAAEAIKTSNETLAAIEGAQSLHAEAEAKATAQAKLEDLKYQITNGHYSSAVRDLADETGKTPAEVAREQRDKNMAIIESITARENAVEAALGGTSESGEAILKAAETSELPTAMQATKIRKQAGNKGADGGAKMDKVIEKAAHKKMAADKELTSAKAELASAKASMGDSRKAGIKTLYKNVTAIDRADAKVKKAQAKIAAAEARVNPLDEALADSHTRAMKQAAIWMDLADRDLESANKSLYFDNVMRQSESITTLASTDIRRDFEDAQMSFGGGAMDSTVYDPYAVAAAAVEKPDLIRTDKINMNNRIEQQINNEYSDIKDSLSEGKDVGNWSPISLQAGLGGQVSIDHAPDVLLPDAKQTEDRKTREGGWLSTAGWSTPESKDHAGSVPSANSSGAKAEMADVVPWSTEKTNDVMGKMGLEQGLKSTGLIDFTAISNGLGVSDVSEAEATKDPANVLRRAGVPDAELEGLADMLASSDGRASDLQSKIADYHASWTAEHGGSKPANSVDSNVQSAPMAKVEPAKQESAWGAKMSEASKPDSVKPTDNDGNGLWPTATKPTVAPKPTASTVEPGNKSAKSGWPKMSRPDVAQTVKTDSQEPVWGGAGKPANSNDGGFSQASNEPDIFSMAPAVKPIDPEPAQTAALATPVRMAAPEVAELVEPSTRMNRPDVKSKDSQTEQPASAQSFYGAAPAKAERMSTDVNTASTTHAPASAVVKPKSERPTIVVDDSPISVEESKQIADKIGRLRSDSNAPGLIDLGGAALADGWGLYLGDGRLIDTSNSIFDDPVKELRKAGATDAEIRQMADFASDFVDSTPTADLRPTVLSDKLEAFKKSITEHADAASDDSNASKSKAGKSRKMQRPSAKPADGSESIAGNDGAPSARGDSAGGSSAKRRDGRLKRPDNGK